MISACFSYPGFLLMYSLHGSHSCSLHAVSVCVYVCMCVSMYTSLHFPTIS